MASSSHTVQIDGETYERLVAEAARRHGSVDGLAAELLGERLPDSPDGVGRAERALEHLADLRARVGDHADAATLVSEGRAELARRTRRT